MQDVTEQFTATPEEISLTREEANEQVEKGRALERLFANPDWQKVIRDGYLQDEAVRLVFLKGDPSLAAEEHQRQLDRDINAIASFRQYIITVRHVAEMARKTLADVEEYENETLEAGE